MPRKILGFLTGGVWMRKYYLLLSKFDFVEERESIELKIL
jgi:hypothetical protein